jgi:glycosyltransferase involved in cell wall biosynthesis
VKGDGLTHFRAVEIQELSVLTQQKELKVSIGIVAYNEANFIDKMLESLLQQNLIQEILFKGKSSESSQTSNQSLTVEIIVIPNGCSDNTAEIARNKLQTSIDLTENDRMTWQVIEVEQPGKSNAWNLYVHSLSDPDAQYLVLMDSDIQLLDPQTLGSLVQLLEVRSEAWVAVDRPIKDVKLKTEKTLIEKLSIAASSLSGNAPSPGKPSWLCGQLYCGRADILRKIYLPTTLPTQDAFLYEILTTEGRTTSRKPERVILADSASHVFESYIRPNRLLRHERWLIIGAAINQLIYSELSPQIKSFEDAGHLIKCWNEQDPMWVNHLVEKVHKNNQWWLIPSWVLTRRFQIWRRKPWFKPILLAPLAAIAFGLDLLLSIQANWQLLHGKGLGYWKQTSSS